MKHKMKPINNNYKISKSLAVMIVIIIAMMSFTNDVNDILLALMYFVFTTVFTKSLEFGYYLSHANSISKINILEINYIIYALIYISCLNINSYVIHKYHCLKHIKYICIKLLIHLKKIISIICSFQNHIVLNSYFKNNLCIVKAFENIP